MVLGSGIRKNLFRIPDPGVKKAPDPGSGSATLINTSDYYLIRIRSFGSAPVLKISLKKGKIRIRSLTVECRKSQKNVRKYLSFSKIKRCEKVQLRRCN
jgi:hypothetical protein